MEMIPLWIAVYVMITVSTVTSLSVTSVKTASSYQVPQNNVCFILKTLYSLALSNACEGSRTNPNFKGKSVFHFLKLA